MNYSKPEVKTLGQAKTVIEAVGKQIPAGLDPPLNQHVFVPAYDLDE